jgi:O-antigen ligase
MKSTFNLPKPEQTRNQTAQWVGEAMVVAMIFGLFFSRALLSTALFCFFLLAPIRLGWRIWLHRSVSDPLVWILGMAWFLPVVSGIWSDDTWAWMDVVRIKLPLLLLPMGWVGFSLSNKWMQRAGWILTVLVFLGAVRSVIPWVLDATSVQAGYLRGKTLLTPLDNDRVRFSWLIVAVLFWMQLQWKSVTGWHRGLIRCLFVFFILFLHVLAVRIGLLTFYMLTGFWIIQQGFNPSLRKWVVPMLLMLLSLPVLMYWLVPTFRDRVHYIRYDWSYTFQGKYLPGGNDAMRIQSLQAAGAVMRSHPVAGVGFGDIRSAMDSVYSKVNPAMPIADRIYPANEWAVYGVGMGWIGCIAFSLGMIALFLVGSPDPVRWRSWVLATVLSLVTDIGLEVQYGVFLVPFGLLFFRGALNRLKNQEIRA